MCDSKNNFILKGFLLACTLLVVAFLFRQFVHHDVIITEVFEMPIPNPDFDNSGFMGFFIVSDVEHFKYFMHEKQKNEDFGFDSLYIQQVIDSLNFETYDFVISYQKRISKLFWNHYLRYYDTGSLIPLTARFEKEITHSLHIYAIYPRHKYRNAAG